MPSAPADGAGVNTGTAELEGFSGIGVLAAGVVAEADEAGADGAAEGLVPDPPEPKGAGPGTVYVVVPLYGSKEDYSVCWLVQSGSGDTGWIFCTGTGDLKVEALWIVLSTTFFESGVEGDDFVAEDVVSWCGVRWDGNGPGIVVCD
jgi:hypothetical protein